MGRANKSGRFRKGYGRGGRVKGKKGREEVQKSSSASTGMCALKAEQEDGQGGGVGPRREPRGGRTTEAGGGTQALAGGEAVGAAVADEVKASCGGHRLVPLVSPAVSRCVLLDSSITGFVWDILPVRPRAGWLCGHCRRGGW